MANATENRISRKQYLKLHPEKYIMVSYELGNPVFVSQMKNLHVVVSPEREQAEIWDSLDISESRLKYHIAATGLKELKFELSERL